MEADKETQTGLASYLKERKIDTVFVTGLATDFCVAWTAIDARHAGLNVYVVDDACRGIDINESVAKAWEQMTAAEVAEIESSKFPRRLSYSADPLTRPGLGSRQVPVRGMRAGTPFRLGPRKMVSFGYYKL